MNWADYFDTGLAHHLVHHCQTGVLRGLLEQQPYPNDDEAEAIRLEVDRRLPERVGAKWLQHRRFPIVLACQNPPDKAPFYSDGLLCWFEPRQQQDVTQVQQRDELTWLQTKGVFFEAVLCGLRLSGGVQELVIKVPEGERRPFSEDAIMDGASAGLAMAVWASWFKDGRRPNKPLVISGEVLEDGSVREVQYVEQKLSGARERGVNILVVPGEPAGMDNGLIRVPCAGVKFKDWLKSCEDQLLKNGIKLVPLPATDGIDPLLPWDFAPFLEEKCRDFTGRQWLFDEIDAWRSCQQEPALLITGDPGAGKSAIVAQLWKVNPGRQVLAVHCCQHDTKETLKPSRFVRSIAAMIAGQLEEYSRKIGQSPVGQRLSREQCDKDPASAFEEGILIPLQEIKAPEQGVRYILIDALDEALLHEGRPNIVDILATRLNRLPTWLRIVATTRNDPAVLERLGSLRAKQLNAHDPQNLEDLADFIQLRLKSPNLAERLVASRRPQEQVIRILQDKSDGNFLYVQQALQAIERDLVNLSKLEQQLPPGLGGLYEIFLSRRFPDEATFAPAKQLLQVVVAAQEPLDEGLLAAATGLDPEEDLPKLLNRLSAYLPQREGKYSVFHTSLADWLTAPESRGNLYYASLKKGHERLADVGWRQYGQSVGKMRPYHLAWLPTHLRHAQRWQELEELLTDLAFLEAKTGAGLIFDLTDDLRQTVVALPQDRPQRHILQLLEEAIRRDIHFIHRHCQDYPQGLFQCLWNSCWWYDCPEAARHYESYPQAPWKDARVKLSALLERWRREKEQAEPDFVWLRSLRAPGVPLGSGLKRVLAGHERSVESVVFSPDGTRIVSGSHDSTVRVWEVDTGRELACLRGHAFSVNSVAFSPDGTRLVSGSLDSTVRVWDVDTGRELACLRGHDDSVSCVAFSPDGTRIVSGSNDCTVRVWEVDTGRELACMYEVECRVNSVAFSPDGASIVSSDRFAAARIWSTSDYTCSRIINTRGETDQSYAGPVSFVDVMADKQPVYAIGVWAGGETQIVIASTGRTIAWFPASRFSVAAAAHSRTRRWAGSGRYIRIISMEGHWRST